MQDPTQAGDDRGLTPPSTRDEFATIRPEPAAETEAGAGGRPGANPVGAPAASASSLGPTPAPARPDGAGAAGGATGAGGWGLDEFLTAGSPLSVLTAARLTEAVARVVAAAHQQGVVHGGLTPARVRLAPAAAFRYVDPERGYLTDEAGRELVPSVVGYRQPTPPGAPPGYDPPEVADGRGPTAASDVYSLGATLYHLLTGRPPEPRGERGEAAPPRSINPHVPRHVEVICLSCLDPDPGRRFAGAGALADALREFLDTHVNRVRCVHCNTSLLSDRPVRTGTTFRCPSCGGLSRADPPDGEAPPAPPSLARTLPSPPASPAPFSGLASPGGASPGRTSRAPQAPGAPLVAGYTVLGELGRGAMGVVYKARHDKLKRVVALKMILPRPGDVSLDLTRFQEEAEAVARLHHPQIVQVYEVGEHDGLPFLALEFATGGTLKKRIDGRPQPPNASAQLLELVARGVHAAHQRGIIHRDLKPANILLIPADPLDDDHAGANRSPDAVQLFGTPKIADFGLAVRFDDDAQPVSSGEVLGTPKYMAPEQARGQNDEVGPAADIYSLGVILYEMLTGKTPFGGDSLHKVLYKVLSEEPAPPSSLRPSVPKDLDAVCLKCLRKDPRERYGSAQALADDLRRFTEGLPVRARPRSVHSRVWNWSLRNPIPASLLVTGLAVLGFGQWRLRALSTDTVHDTALASADQQSRLVHETYKLYSDVARRVVAANDRLRSGAKDPAGKAGLIEVTHKYPEVENSIPIPARFAIALGERMEGLADEEEPATEQHPVIMQLKVTSKYPFRERKGSPPRPGSFEMDALNFLAKPANRGKPYYQFGEYRNVRALRYATAFTMEAKCLKCHNDPALYTLPGVSKTDWKAGDVRGILEVVLPLERSTRETYNAIFTTYAEVTGVAVLVMSLTLGTFYFSRLPRDAAPAPAG